MEIFNTLRKTAGIALFSAVALFSTAQAQEVITLQEAINRTLQSNLSVQQALNQILSSEVDLTQSKASMLPSLNASLSSNVSYGRGLDQTTFQIINQKFSQSNGGLSTDVNLFSGFAKVNQVKQNKILLDASKTSLEKAKNDLLLQVVTAYLNVIYNDDLLKIAKDQLNVNTKTLEREEAFLKEGMKTLADVSQAKAQVASAELTIATAQNNYDISLLNLAQLMERPAGDMNFKVEVPQLSLEDLGVSPVDANTVYNEALSRFPDIRLSQFNRLAAEKAVDIAKGNMYPKLSFEAGMGSSYSYRFNSGTVQESFSSQLGDRFNQYVGLRMSIPIFNGLAARSNVNKAKINLENYKIEEQKTRNNLNKVITQAHTDLYAAQSKYKSSLKAFEAQKDAFYAVEQRYGVGLVNSLDFSTALTNKNKAEIDLIQAKYDLIFRTKVIDYYLGKEIKF